MFFWQYGLNPILYLTAALCLSFTFWHVEKNPSQMKRRTGNSYASDCSGFFFNEAFLLGIMQNALCFWAIKTQCVKILYFISVGLFCSANRGESLWSLHWWITPRCSHVSQLCEKKVAQVCEDRSFCRVLVNSGQYCNISGGPWQASNLTMSLKYRHIQNGSFFCVFLL